MNCCITGSDQDINQHLDYFNYIIAKYRLHFFITQFMSLLLLTEPGPSSQSNATYDSEGNCEADQSCCSHETAEDSQSTGSTERQERENEEEEYLKCDLGLWQEKLTDHDLGIIVKKLATATRRDQSSLIMPKDSDGKKKSI